MNRCTQLTLWQEIQDLKKKKAELEFQLHSIEEKEKTLEEKAKLLEEKWEIHQLEEKIKIKTDGIQKLESRINELEQKLGKSETTTIVTPEPSPQQTNNGYSLRKLFGDH